MTDLAPYDPLIWIDFDPTKVTSAERENYRERGMVEMDIKNPTSGARAYLDARLTGLSGGSGETGRQRGASFGLLFVGSWGASDTLDNTALFDEIVAESALTGRQIVLEAGKTYPGNFRFTNQPVRFYHANTGFIGHMKGKNAVTITNDLGPEAAITDVRGVSLPSTDTGSPHDAYHELTISRAAMLTNNPQRGDAFWVYADNFFTDGNQPNAILNGATVPGAADFNGADLRTYTGQWISVLGVGMDITDIAGSGGIRQGALILGATSGATASVQSSVVSSQGQRTAVVAGVKPGVGTGKGYFLAGENLLVDGVARGTLSARGAYIVTDEPLVFDISINPRLAKGRLDIPVDLNGIRTVAVGGDIDEFVGNAMRRPAIRTNAVVNGTGYAYVKSSWMHGVEDRIGYRWRNAGVRIEKGPAHAEDYEGGWSYGWQVVGGGSKSELRIWAENVRHAFSTNTVPKNAPLAELNYIMSAGVAHDIRVHHSTAISCLDAAFDTHGGSVRITFEHCYVDGGGSAGRSQGRAAGFQLRGFGNIVRNNTIKNVVNGIREVSTQFPAPFDMRVIIEDNTMVNVTGTAYDLQAGSKGSEAKGKTRIYINGGSVFLGNPSMFNGMPANANSATFLRMDVGWLQMRDYKLFGLRGGSPGYFGVEGSSTLRPDYVELGRGKVDYSEMPAGGVVRGWQIQSKATIPYFGHFDEDITGGVGSMIRVGSGIATAPQVIFTDGSRDIDTSSTQGYVQVYTPLNQTGTSNDTNAATVNASVAPTPGAVSVLPARTTGSVSAKQEPVVNVVVPAMGILSVPISMDGVSQVEFVDVTPNFGLPAGVFALPARVSVSATPSTPGTIIWPLINMTAAAVTVPGGNVVIRVRK